LNVEAELRTDEGEKAIKVRKVIGSLGNKTKTKQLRKGRPVRKYSVHM
jgi:hypothetical protein